MKQWDLRGITEETSGGAVRTADETAVTRIVERDVSVTLRPNLDSVRVLVDQLPAIFWTTDQTLTFTSALGAGLASLGLGPNQIVGMKVHDFFPETDSPMLEAHRSALGGESAPFHMTWGDRVFRAQAGPLRDAEGRTIGTICVGVGVDGPGDAEEWHFLEAG